MRTTRFTYTGLNGDPRTVLIYDAEPVESVMFGRCLAGHYGIVTPTSVVQVEEIGLFRMTDAIAVEETEQTELAA